jgi:hypothetical protein
MLAVVAAVLFALGFLFHITGADVPTLLGPTSLLLLGLTALALHQAGFGTSTAGSTSRAWARRR